MTHITNLSAPIHVSWKLRISWIDIINIKIDKTILLSKNPSYNNERGTFCIQNV